MTLVMMRERLSRVGFIGGEATDNEREAGTDYADLKNSSRISVHRAESSKL